MKEHYDSKSKYTVEDIIKMFEFLVDIFSRESYSDWEKSIPLQTDIFLCLYEAEFI